MTARHMAAAIRARDPDLHALHRGIRAAFVVPIVFGFASTVIDDAQLATFAAFGCFALLLFVDFGGRPSTRLGAFAMLGVVGAVLITAGTLMSRPGWLAVVGMGVAGFAVLFGGVLSSSAAGAARAALLTFILPVTLPGTAANLGPRLAGWGIALLAAVPAAMLMWPPRGADELRRSTSATCHALAALLDPPRYGLGAHRDALLAGAKVQLGTLRQIFRATASRPVGLSTGSRALVRMVDDLEWLMSVAAHTCSHGWPDYARDVTVQAAEVLAASARALDSDRSSATHRLAQLRTALDRLAEHRDDLARVTVQVLAEPGRSSSLPPYRAHELAYAVDIAGETAAMSAAAEARPVLGKLIGRRPEGTTLGTLSAAEHIAAGHVNPRSVWLHNSLRGAAGLAIAVAVAKLSGAQHEFWVVLGAMSVLRSNAVSTGSTVLRAIAGTVLGFAVGGVLVAVIGTSPAVLWPLLPVAVFIAAVAPDVISFAAGQAAFTVVVIILFNIIAPEGWRVGLVRVEDVAVGCAASLAVGLLLWPRGAAGALGRAMADSYRRGVDYLAGAVDFTTDGGSEPSSDHTRARAAAWRLDDALRQYLAETGAKQVPLTSLTILANGATRLRLAAEAITSLQLADGHDSEWSQRFAPARTVLREQVHGVRDWYGHVADVLDDASAEPGNPVDGGELSNAEQRLLTAFAEPATNDDHVAEHAQRMLWTGEYLDDVARFRSRLVEPLRQVRARQAARWWH